MLRPILILTASIVISITAHAHTSSASQNITYLEWHNSCLKGDTKIIDAQIEKFESRLSRSPDDRLAQAYLGSAYALRAKHSSWPLTKLKFLNKGKATMDTAVESSPNDPRVSMVRAIAYYKVPKFLNCRATSIADFKRIAPIAVKEPSPLETAERQAILYYAYLAYKEEGIKEAEHMRLNCYQLCPASKYGALTKP